MRLLIVEDEPMLARSMAEHLATEGYAVDVAATFAEASERIGVDEYDGILLDLTLPGGDGLDLLSEVLQAPYDPGVLIITARGAVSDRVSGLLKGADDYLPKPFALAELSARLHAVLRRKFKVTENVIRLGSVVLSLDTPVTMVGANEVRLTNLEYRILRYLMLNKGRTVTRLTLAEHVWGSEVDDRISLDALNTHVKNLRKKLSNAGAGEVIHTAHGIGYRAEET